MFTFFFVLWYNTERHNRQDIMIMMSKIEKRIKQFQYVALVFGGFATGE